MEHMKGYDLKRFFPALAWGVSCIFFLLVIFFICSKYGEYRLLCNVGLVDDGIDELHTTLLSVSVGALVCLSGIAGIGLVWTLRKSKVRPLKAESMDDALQPGRHFPLASDAAFFLRLRKPINSASKKPMAAMAVSNHIISAILLWDR